MTRSGSPAPVVSVVIPCHNAEPWIRETLASVLGQQGVSYEVLVVDDGSTDQSVSVAAAAGPAVRVVWQTQQGPSAARNAGTQLAVGTYLQYLDADDVLLPGTLAARVARLEATGADVALTSWRRFTDGAAPEHADGPEMRRVLGSRPDVELLTDAWWPPGAVLYRRTMVDTIGPWRSDLPIIQDARYLLDAALAGARFVYVDGVGLRYRERPGSLSRQSSIAFIEDCYRNAVDLHERWQATGALDPLRRRALVRVYAHVARPFFSADRQRFHEVCERLTRLDPQFRPESPRALRLLTGLLGYPAAEQIAYWWRQMKGTAGAAP